MSKIKAWLTFRAVVNSRLKIKVLKLAKIISGHLRQQKTHQLDPNPLLKKRKKQMLPKGLQLRSLFKSWNQLQRKSCPL